MEEVLREYVTAVNVIKGVMENFILPVFNAIAVEPFQSDPMILLDGIPIFDFNKLIDTIMKVRKLELYLARITWVNCLSKV
jgi:hypothetical protein